MTLNDCRRILQVTEAAPLDEIKRSYRRLAFALHPDLNPDSPDAARRFQELNEAYVLLTQHEGRDAEEGEARKAYADARSRFGGFGQGRGTGAAHAGKSGPEAGKSGPEAGRAGAADGHQQRGTTAGRNSTGAGGVFSKRRGEQAYANQEDVLRDILRDPFARRVYEDIYSQLRRSGGAKRTPPPPPKRKLSLEWGEKRMALDLSQGVIGAVRGWMRRQIDEEQTMHLPVPSLVPGARLRLQIRQGLSGEVRTVEVTLPSDFVVGRPLRLKGLGKRLGPWQGDLYLRLLART